MAKGEIQFTTIALLVITAVVLIGIIIWFLPAFNDAGSGLTDVGDAAGSEEAIVEAKCDAFCATAQKMEADQVATSEFCTYNLDGDATMDCTGVFTCDNVACS